VVALCDAPEINGALNIHASCMIKISDSRYNITTQLYVSNINKEIVYYKPSNQESRNKCEHQDLNLVG
jgi:hypothetical protein